MNIDYIIVGLGLAGISFIEELEKHNKTYLVYEDNSQNSSKVAGGMYNPIVLKRFTPVWNGEQQLKVALPFYKKLEKKFSTSYIQKMPVYRVFKSIEEQNNWFAACDKPVLKEYMIPKIIQNTNKGILAPFGFGKLQGTGKVDTNKLLEDYRLYLNKQEKIIQNTFQYKDLTIKDDFVQYKDITATKIVFCEGFGIKKNPFFNYLPLNEAKGELLIINAPDLKIDFLLKSAISIMPLGNDNYKVGATFNWKDKTPKPTKEGRKELVEKLDTVINTSYKISNQVAGIRPTVKDRRPLVGKHPKHKQLAILNGLGTRGVMIAPKMARELYGHIENNQSLDREITIKRFEF